MHVRSREREGQRGWAMGSAGGRGVRDNGVRRAGHRACEAGLGEALSRSQQDDTVFNSRLRMLAGNTLEGALEDAGRQPQWSRRDGLVAGLEAGKTGWVI